MLYLSKGILCKGSTKEKLCISRGNNIYTIEGLEAEIWLDGRFKLNTLPDTLDYEDALLSLCANGLAEFEYQSDAINKFRILTRCICCPAKSNLFSSVFKQKEKNILKWLSLAGIRLTTAELTYLCENKISPTDNLIYDENRQALIETIYTKSNIFDNILENQMENAVCRNEITDILMELLRKRKIVML